MILDSVPQRAIRTLIPRWCRGLRAIPRLVSLGAARDAATSEAAARRRCYPETVTAPAELREQLQPLNDRELIAACRALRYETMSGPADAACYTLRALAERYHQLDTEARLHDRVLATLTDRTAPALTSLFMRMRFHEPTISYVNRRTTEGKTKKEILRCLKRLLIREIYHIIVAPHKEMKSLARLDNYSASVCHQGVGKVR